MNDAHSRQAAQLRRTEELFRATFEQAAVGIAHVGLDGRWLRVNRRLAAIVGYEKDELLALTFQDITHPHDLDADLANLRALLAGEIDNYEMEKRYIRKDGSAVWVNLSASLVRDPDGAPEYFISVVEDIDRRKVSEAAQAHLAAIVASSMDAIVGKSLDGTVTSWNPAAEALFGYAEAEIVGRSINLVIPPDRQDEEVEILGKIRCGERVAHYETVRQRRDGSRFDVALTVSPIRDRGGAIIGASKIVRDISGTKRTAAVLREREAQFRAMADNISQLAWMADATGWIYWYNKRWFDYTGTTLEEMQGWGWRKVHHPEHVERVVARIRRCFETGEPWEDTFPLRGKDGAYRWFLSRAQPIRDEAGRVVRWFGTNTDVTEQRATEAALREINETLEQRVATALIEREAAQQQLAHAQKMEAVGQLTGGVAHDFNNLLTAISGNLELICHAAGSSAERVRHLAAAAVRATERGARLTASLLAFARKQRLETQTAEANLLLAEFAPLVRRAVGESVEVEFDLDPALAACEVDAGQLEAAVLNLALNARDAMPAGGRLTITTQNAGLGLADLAGNVEAAPGRFVAITVQDTGHGMEPGILERVFEPFFTTKEVGKGTGLGLSQVYGFVRQLGGHVAIDSTPGRGTRVTMYLPAVAVAETAATAPMLALAEVAPLPPATVLVVEDDDDVRAVICAALEEAGCRVLSAGDASRALAILVRQEPIDVLFTDVVMPGAMNGVELARAARCQRPGLGVLLTSG
jgi:PAS domain S-box-containing protein